MLKSFRTYQLAKEFYYECEKITAKPYFKDQLGRAALSIVNNLAEGSAKPTEKDRKRFYAIALGSFRECQCMLDLNRHNDLLNRFDHLGACLFKLSRF